jgi:hypothetical protein
MPLLNADPTCWFCLCWPFMTFLNYKYLLLLSWKTIYVDGTLCDKPEGVPFCSHCCVIQTRIRPLTRKLPACSARTSESTRGHAAVHVGSTVADLLVVAGGADAAGASPALLALRPAAGVRVDSGAATATTSVRVVCVGARWGRWDLWGRRRDPWGRRHELGTCDYLLWTSSDAC